MAESNPDFDPGVELASMRTNGADRFDPVRFHFIEVMARRGLEQQGAVRRILNDRLAEALADYRARFEQAQHEARATLARVAGQCPAAADDLQRLFAAGDFSGMRRFVASLEKKEQQASLAGLTRYITQLSPEGVDAGPVGDGDFAARSELKTVRNSRNTWSKLSVVKQVAQAIEQAPKNAGPLNSHMLVLRSFELMRDISPDYLNRFVSYIDTLLWLDQADSKSKPTPKKPLTAKATKK
jgi:hypothetical protein